MVVRAFDVKRLHNPIFLAPYLLQEKMFGRSQTFIQPTLLGKQVIASVVQRLNNCLGLYSTSIFIKHYMYILANLLLNYDWHQRLELYPLIPGLTAERSQNGGSHAQ